MYFLIRTEDALEAAKDAIDTSKIVFCDTETYEEEGKCKGGGLYGAIRLFQLYQEGWDSAILIDCMFIDLEIVLDFLKPMHLVFHNASYDLHTINCHTPELWLPTDIDDTLYLARLALYKKGPKFDFYTCLKITGWYKGTVKDLDKKENQQADWKGPLSKVMLQYAACDVLYLSLLYKEVESAKNTKNYILDKQNLLYAIEYTRRGIPLNRKKVREELRKATIEYEKVLETLPVNPNSPKQVTNLLGTDSSDMLTLETLKLQGNPQAGQIRDARQLSKTIMFLHKYNRNVIRGFYNPCGAITGRFSCTGGDRIGYDNIQQIPRRILPCMEAPEGKIFIYNDYTGLELYMAVSWVGEPTMHRLITEGKDIHTYTASVIYKKKEEDITKFERMIGKICNFLLIYGGSLKTLRNTIISWGQVLMNFSDVKEIYNAWMEEYHFFKEWHAMNKRILNVYGHYDVSTALGRTVRVYSINDMLNVPIQGSSSEVTKTSLKYLKERYPDENLISTIHDSNTLLQDLGTESIWEDRLNECMVEAWNYVVQTLAISDINMPATAQSNTVWSFD